MAEIRTLTDEEFENSQFRKVKGFQPINDILISRYKKLLEIKSPQIQVDLNLEYFNKVKNAWVAKNLKVPEIIEEKKSEAKIEESEVESLSSV